VQKAYTVNEYWSKKREKMVCGGAPGCRCGQYPRGGPYPEGRPCIGGELERRVVAASAKKRLWRTPGGRTANNTPGGGHPPPGGERLSCNPAVLQGPAGRRYRPQRLLIGNRGRGKLQRPWEAPGVELYWGPNPCCQRRRQSVVNGTKVCATEDVGTNLSDTIW